MAHGYTQIIPATVLRDHTAYYQATNNFDIPQLFAYPTTAVVAASSPLTILQPFYNYLSSVPAPTFAPPTTKIKTMYNNLAYSHSLPPTTTATAIATPITTTFPDYTNCFPYTTNFYNDQAIMSSYYGGAYPSQSTTYRTYPQVDENPTFYQRSRMAPFRTKSPKVYKTVYNKRNRCYTIDPTFFEPYEYRSYSGPWKNAKNWPMYRKRKEPNTRIQTYQESEFGGSPIDQQPKYYQKIYADTQPTVLRRIRPYYSPSYVSYPPSTMHLNRIHRKHDERYLTLMRITVKVIELLLGAATIGLVLAPFRGMPFNTFIKMTHTEWQGLVLGIASTFSMLCIIMLLSTCIGYRYQLWRKIDWVISLIASIGYLVAGAVETYYAACYPPYGEKIGKLCYRMEWIIASALIFINIAVYIMDCVLSFRKSISMI